MLRSSIYLRLCIAAAVAVVGLALPAVASATAPAVTTGEAEATATRATLHGTVNPFGQYTLYGWGYGLTNGSSTEYEHTASQGTIAAGIYSPVAVEGKLEGLTPNTTYHYVVGAFGDGFTLGEDRTFKTLPASIARFEAESYPATISGSQDNSNRFKVISFPESKATVTCASASFSASAASPTYPNSALPLEAKFGECGYGSTPATVTMNSCHYVAHVANPGPPYTGSTEIVCSKAGDKIEIYAPSVNCKVKIGAQMPSGTTGYENTGTGSGRKLVAGVSGNELTVEKVGVGCVALVGNASYGGPITLQATNGEAKAIGFYAGGEAVKTQGVFVSGKKSEVEAEQPKLNAESFPLTVGFEDNPEAPLRSTLFGFGSSEPGLIHCGTSSYEAEASSAANSLNVSAKFGECKLGTATATVTMNSCHFSLSLANAGPPYTGSTGIACSKAGDKIEIYAPSVNCKVKIGAQTPAGATGYENLGSGSDRSVRANISATEVSYEESGVGCTVLKGNGKDGRFSGSLRLYGIA